MAHLLTGCRYGQGRVGVGAPLRPALILQAYFTLKKQNLMFIMSFVAVSFAYSPLQPLGQIQMKLRTPALATGAAIIAAGAVLSPIYVNRGVFMPELASPFVLVEADQGHGSAVHIGNGYYLTAAHVADAVEAPKLVNDQGASAPAEVLWSNQAYDVALMHVADARFTASAPLSCSTASVGTQVVAHGNPGELPFITSEGKVGGAAQVHGPWKEAFVVDMTIVPGMSGGGIVNERGEVVAIIVGVQTFKMGITGFGIAVPSSVACELMGVLA